MWVRVRNKTKKLRKLINKKDYFKNVITVLFSLKPYLLSFKSDNIKVYFIINLTFITYNNYVVIHLINN